MVTGFILFGWSFVSTATPVDSLQLLLDQAIREHDWDKQTDLAFQLGKLHLDQKQYEKAADFFTHMRLSAQSQKKRAKEIEALYYLGKAYRRAENYNLAIAKLEALIELTAHTGSPFLDKAYFELSKSYQAIGDFENAYKNQLKCLELREEKQDSSGQMRCYYQLGTIFYYQDNFDLALQYYENTKDLAEKIHDKKYLYNSLGALGSTYQSMGDLQKSLSYSKKALALATEMNYPTGLAYTYANLGEYYFGLMRFDSAETCIRQSLRLSETIRDNSLKAAVLRILGKIHLQTGNPKAGLACLDSSLFLAKKYDYTSRILEVYLDMADAYEATNHPEMCGQYLKSYIRLKDSIVNESLAQELGKIQTKYEVLKREKEIAVKDSKIEQLYRKVLIGSVAFLLLLLVVIGISYRRQSKINRLLESKTREIEEQNKKLARSNAELQQFAYIASHDLKEPLRNIGSFASLIRRRYADQMNEECLEFFSYIQNGVARMYQLLNDVLSFSRLDYEDHQTQLVNPKEIIEETIFKLSTQIQDKNAVILVGSMPEIHANPVHLGQLFQNLISNGLKFSNGKSPEIKVFCRKTPDNQYVFSVQDNGIGIHMKYKDKIFEMFQRLEKQNGQEGTGVGLAICKKIVDQYGGKIWVRSKPQQGATFFFAFPAHPN